jgi:hypothetical protein
MRQIPPLKMVHTNEAQYFIDNTYRLLNLIVKKPFIVHKRVKERTHGLTIGHP